MNNDEVIDQYTFYSYKPAWEEYAKNIPHWVGDENKRRLQAYQMLEAYFHNASRIYMNTADNEERLQRREYGEPHVVVSQTVSSVLGKGGLTLHIRGAEQEARAEPSEGDPEGVAPTELDAVLDELKDWAKKERFWIKTTEGERCASKLGDAVYVLGWSPSRERVVLNVWDPTCYFPVWDASWQDDEGFNQEFPNRVHLAYEFDDEVNGELTPKIRRITWELLPYENNKEVTLPWGSAKVTCWMTDAVWTLDSLKTNNGEVPNVDNFNIATAEVRANEVDLGIDFIPVIHMPNNVAELDGFGTSSIGMVMQVIDDIEANDTDSQRAGALAGTPAIALSGGQAPKDDYGNIKSYGPGTVWETGEGTMTAVDTSQGLVALMNYGKSLLERLSVNARIPEAMMGRIKPSEVPSGIALWLSFAPHSSMIDEMRLVREEKYNLMLKFVIRWMLIHDKVSVADASKVFPFVKFGSYLPADKSEAMTMIVQAMNSVKRPMSLKTAVRVAQEAGFPIEDIAAELALIQGEDFEGAASMASATGDINDARAYLGLPPIADINGPTTDELGNPLVETGADSGLPGFVGL